MKKYLIVLIIVAQGLTAFSQVMPQVKANQPKEIEEPIRRKNGLQGSLYGLGGMFSASYERFMFLGSGSFFALRVGVGTFFEGVTTPHAFTLNLGKNMNHFELGVGGTYMNDVETGYSLNAIVAYRHQNIWGGFYWRIGGAIPVFKTNRDFFVFPIELSAGFCF